MASKRSPRQIAAKRAKRCALFGKQFGKCCYCFVDMLFDPPHHNSQKYATIEHLIPTFHGGDDSKENTSKMSCRRCNELKSNMTDAEFMTLIAYFAFNFDMIRKMISFADQLAAKALKGKQ